MFTRNGTISTLTNNGTPITGQNTGNRLNKVVRTNEKIQGQVS